MKPKGRLLERIREHDRLSTWQGELAQPTHTGYGRNTLCGDEVWLTLKVSEGVIEQIRFRGRGCVISQACASMLCEGAEGQSVEQILKMSAEELLDFEIAQLSIHKKQCALTAFQALQRILADTVLARK